MKTDIMIVTMKYLFFPKPLNKFIKTIFFPSKTMF